MHIQMLMYALIYHIIFSMYFTVMASISLVTLKRNALI